MNLKYLLFALSFVVALVGNLIMHYIRPFIC